MTIKGRDSVLLAYGGTLLVVVLLVIGRANPKWWSSEGFVYRFQTLIGAGIALLAATIGAMAVYHQTYVARRRSFREDQLKALATRATLPHTLNRLSTYAERCMRWLEQVRKYAGRSGIIRKGLPTPAPPELEWRDIEHLSSAVVQVGPGGEEALARLLSRLQVHASRMRGIADELAVGTSRILALIDIDGLALDTASISSRINKIYPYSRRTDSAADFRVFYSDICNELDRLEYEGMSRDFKFELIRNHPEREWEMMGTGGELAAER